MIKTNHIFTISEKTVEKKLFSLAKQKKQELYKVLEKSISRLND